jgi:hypothetical protein
VTYVCDASIASCTDPPTPTNAGRATDDDHSGESQSIYRMGDYIIDRSGSTTSDWIGAMTTQARAVADDLHRMNGEGGAPSQ